VTTLAVRRKSASSHRRAAWAAIASGVVGIVALAFILAAVSERTNRLGAGRPGALSVSLQASHDVGLMLQAVLIIPAALILHAFGRRRSRALSGANVGVGVAALSLIALVELLLLINVVPTRLDTFYMPPLGVVGVWLIVANWLGVERVPRALIWLGTVAGLGLAVLGTSAFLFLTFQALGGAAAMADSRTVKWNRELHVGLAVGTLIGRTMFPIWAMLLGRKLLLIDQAA
jgi:hypothetical protein